jgi:hypothetical protein
MSPVLRSVLSAISKYSVSPNSKSRQPLILPVAAAIVPEVSVSAFAPWASSALPDASSSFQYEIRLSISATN